MQITFTYDSSVASAPAAFKTALQTVADELDSIILNPITVDLGIGWGEVNGGAITGNTLSAAGARGYQVSYRQLVNALSGKATSSTDMTFLAGLPTTDPNNGGTYFLSTAQEKALGLINPATTEIDGRAGFSSTANWDFTGSSGMISTKYDFTGLALQELTHSLGRIMAVNFITSMDLLTYGSNGKIDVNNTDPRYLSLDGGRTDILNFDTTVDRSDFAAGSPIDPFDAYFSPGQMYPWTPLDSEIMNVLGYNGRASAPLPPSVVTPPPPVRVTPPVSVTPPVGVMPLGGPNNFFVADTSPSGRSPCAGWSGHSQGQSYSGPVAGLTKDIIIATSDNINVTAEVPNVFISLDGGSGLDAIQVSTGNNVLSGSVGSSFLNGGSGDDTFYLDDRHASASIWSTIANFHSGDNAVVWGVTPSDFSLSWVDGLGAFGYKGLTLIASAPGNPLAVMTLSGHTSADLKNGSLTIGFGRTQDLPNLPGSNYMSIHAV